MDRVKKKAESIRFAHKLKLEIEKIDKFGAVRVVPDSQATSDLYIVGKILESNSEEVELDIKVADISEMFGLMMNLNIMFLTIISQILRIFNLDQVHLTEMPTTPYL